MQHFRSFTDSLFEFEPGVNIIVGPNASGKTSILEALHMLAGGALFKGNEADVVQFDADWMRLDEVLDTDSTRVIKLERSGELFKKSYVLDDVAKARLSEHQQLPLVLFEPSLLHMLAGEPALRREFLDGVLVYTVHGYGQTLKNYRRALAQRNTLLKRQQVRHQPTELFVWDLRLSDLGGALFAARSQFVATLQTTLPPHYKSISGRDDEISIAYETSIDTADYTNNLLKKLHSSYDKDIARGFTGSGPHRDDLLLSINGHDARSSASRGESRSLLLALKIAELEALERARGVRPTLLLDDVFSELDGHRRRALADTIKHYQTFITTTDADVVIEHFSQKAHIIPLSR